MSNAIEASPDGGRVTISGRLIDDDRHLRLAIADTGPGIPPRMLGHVFDLFFTTKASGTGLGLAVAQKIVKRHGGRIAVTSEIGSGSCVTIDLPLAPPGAPPVPGEFATSNRV